jgi:hypothetical protein
VHAEDLLRVVQVLERLVVAADFLKGDAEVQGDDRVIVGEGAVAANVVARAGEGVDRLLMLIDAAVCLAKVFPGVGEALRGDDGGVGVLGHGFGGGHGQFGDRERVDGVFAEPFGEEVAEAFEGAGGVELGVGGERGPVRSRGGFEEAVDVLFRCDALAFEPAHEPENVLV